VKPPSPLTFFIDRSLGRDVIPQALIDAGYAIKVHDHFFAQTTKDEDWLDVCGSKGWVALTADKRVNNNPLERQAILQAGVVVFRLPAAQRKAAETAATIIAAMPTVIDVVTALPVPLIGTITATAKVLIVHEGMNNHHPPREYVIGKGMKPQKAKKRP
jgi:hypothetical protein